MNPRLSLLQPYPFERLRQWCADVTPNPARAPIDLSIGEPRHPTPALLTAALAAGMNGLANYPMPVGPRALHAQSLLSDLRRRGALSYNGSAMSGAVAAASIAAWSDEAHVIANRAECAEAVDRVETFTRSL